MSHNHTTSSTTTSTSCSTHNHLKDTGRVQKYAEKAAITCSVPEQKPGRLKSPWKHTIVWACVTLTWSSWLCWDLQPYWKCIQLFFGCSLLLFENKEMIPLPVFPGSGNRLPLLLTNLLTHWCTLDTAVNKFNLVLVGQY